MYQQLSPNMLKTFDECPRKFDFKYMQGIQMPVNDDIYEFGKNIHAIASYYLRKENIDKLEKALTKKESEVWNYLKSSKYFSYETINTEYNLAFRIENCFVGGRLDALVKDNQDNYYILDYKTGSIPKNPKYDFQTMIYILCVKYFFNTDKINFVYLDLKQRENVLIQYTKDLEVEYISHLKNIIGKINSYEKIEKKENCKCEYSIICY